MDFDMRQWQDRMMAYQVYENDLRKLLMKHLTPGAHFYDIGANIGYLSLLAAKLVGSTGSVQAFEPHPKTKCRLEKNVALNNMQDIVKVHQLALGDEEGVLKLVSYGNASGLTSRYNRGDHLGNTSTFECLLVRLDTIKGLPHPDVIKIDCEGSEDAVIEGAKDIISSQYPPIIIFEYSSEWHTYGARKLSEVCDRINEFNSSYSFYDLGDRCRELGSKEIIELSCCQYVNIVCLPNSR